MMRRLAILVPVLIGLMAGAAPAARAECLAADLSKHLVEINTNFTGEQVLLFGVREEAGDIVVVVRGPLGDVQVRRKRRIAGIWVNADRVRFMDVPSFYAAAASRPLAEVMAPAVLKRQEIGLDQVKILPAPGEDEEDMAAFREALVESKQRLGHFSRIVGTVSFFGDRLFRATLDFPANVPTGGYLVQALLIRDGAIVCGQTTPLIISKSGLSADIAEVAYTRSATYGALAIAGALLAGWAAHLAFRRL